MISYIDNPHNISSAEIVIGIPSYNEAKTIAIPTLQASLGLTQYFSDKTSVIINVDNNSKDGTREAFLNTKTEAPKIYVSTPENIKGNGYNINNLLKIAAELRAKAVIMIDADLTSITPEWIESFLEPIFDGYDFVVPIYSRHKYDGTITNNIAYPLLRTLYGLRVRQPIAGDFGISGKLARSFLVEQTWTDEVYHFGIDIWMTTIAICRNFKVCQTFLGTSKAHRTKDPAGLGSMFSQVVGTCFQLMIAFEYLWKDVFESRPSVIYGFGLGHKENYPEVIVDNESLYQSFIDSFKLYSDIWQNVLDPVNMNAIKKLKDLNKEDFYFDSSLWARIVFDFAIAFNAGEIQRDQLLQALIPLYHSRTLSFINTTLEMDTKEAEAIEERLNRNFESEKNYLIKFWDLNSKNSDIAKQLLKLGIKE
ncbi:MAG: glycosyltransferase [Thermodesulfobacteriota bacterium]